MTRTRPYLLTALLLDVLETEGWKIGTGQQLRIQELLRQLPDDVDDDALGLALAPLLARNPQEQSLVYEKLEECRRRADELAEVPSAYRAQEQAEAARTHRRWRIWLPLALLGLLGLGIGIGYWQMGKPQPVEIIRKEFSVNKGQNTQICASDFADSDSLRGKVTDLTIKFPNSISQKDKNGESALGAYSIQNDTCLLYAAKDTIGQDSLVLSLAYAKGEKTELQLRIYIAAPPPILKTEEEKPQPALPAPLFQPKPLPYPHDITALAIEPPARWVQWLAQWWPWLRWAVLGLLAAALYVAWQYWQQKRRKLIAELRNRDKPPYIWNIRIPGSDEMVTGDDFAHLLQVLRRRANADAWRLDLKATIAATAERGGMPEFRYRQQTRPVDYLLLIDRQSLYNHRAQLYDALYRAFREQEIEIARFFYDSDIRLCHNEDHPNGLRLSEISQRYGDARLIVVGTGAQIISPLSGRLESWAGIFQSWGESALFTPKPPGEWGRNERRLSECFSAVLPASLQSLSFWVEETEAGEDARFEEWRENVHDTPKAFWQPDPEVPLPLLQLQYDQRMLRWIAACAIYPTLHYDLTLWLGKLVTGSSVDGLPDGLVTRRRSNQTHPPITNKPVHQSANSPITLDELSALFRLRWFVDGYIPQSARAALLDWLETEDPALLAQTRLALADLLRQNPPPQDSAAWNDHALSVAITEWLATQDAKRRKELEKQIAQLLESGAEADFVALKYLDKPRGPLDFIVPDAWKKFVHPGGKPALGNRIWVIGGLVLGLLGMSGLLDWKMGDWLKEQMNQCKGEMVEYTPKPSARFDNFVPTRVGIKSDVQEKNVPIMLCLDSPEDSLLWYERLLLDVVAEYKLQKLDSLFNEIPHLEQSPLVDSMNTELKQNLAAAAYNNGVYYYQKNLKDSACLWFAYFNSFRDSIINADPDFDRALAWCDQPNSATALPPVRLLGPISIQVVDAATSQPLSNAKLLPQGMKPNTVRRKGSGFTLTPPPDWASPSVTLLVKAEGYMDTVYNLSVDNVRAFPRLGLRKAPATFSILKGTVLEETSSTLLIDVLVNIENGPSTLTNAAGQFELKVPSNNSADAKRYNIRLSKAGYQPAEMVRFVQPGESMVETGRINLKEFDEKANTGKVIDAQKPPPVEEVSTPTTPIPIPTMLPVPGGTFRMGSTKKDMDAESNEKPAHQVSLSDFEMGKTEVTIEQYLAFCDETKTHYPQWLESGNDYNIETGSDDYYKNKGMSRANKNHPITGVSRNDAATYCDWLSQKVPGRKFRLPTEAEWEYAARGGQAGEKDGFKYAGSNNLDEVAWYSSNSDSKTHPVGQKKKNQLGLYDMSGNVWEWCADWFGDYKDTGKPFGNPKGPDEGSRRVNRGGSWLLDAQYCRVANRNHNTPEVRDDLIGFRLASSPQ